MAEQDFDAKEIERKVHDLNETMNRIRTAQANREDVVVDMKHAKLSRLELLAEDLSSVFEDIPSDNEQFEFAISQGETPRLWIDMTSFLRMGADGREYEFVKDTRLGRTILARSNNREQMGHRVTDYVAERILERERMIEGDWISANRLARQRNVTTSMLDDAEAKPAIEDDVTDQDKPFSSQEEDKFPQDGSSNQKIGVTEKPSFAILTWFLIGLLFGLVLLFAIMFFDLQGPMVNWITSQFSS